VRNRGLILVGAVTFILGVFLVSPVAAILLKTVGWLAMAAGLIALAVGVYNAVLRRG
jgi:uncharacterized membrane protein YiaA